MKYLLLTFVVPFLLVDNGVRRDSLQKGRKEITWYSMLEAQKLAHENNKKVLVYSMATWCSYCKKMEAKVYPDPSVRKALNTYFYPVKIDIESKNDIVFNGQSMTEREFAGHFGVRGTPTFFFVDKKGHIVGMQPGYIPAGVFKKLLVYIGTDSYKVKDFDTYTVRH